MNISSISANSNSTYPSVTNNSEIVAFEKEKAELQSELQEVYQSKEDEKTKQEKVKQIQLQIQQLEQQIQQKKSEKNSVNKVQQANTENTNNIKAKDNIKNISENKATANGDLEGNIIDVYA